MSQMDSVIETAAPDHVPEELVWRHSLEEFAMEGDDPYLAISRLHDGPDIFYAIGNRLGPSWVLTRHALVQEAFVKHQYFSSACNSDAALLLGVDWKLNPLEIDPPDHRLYRNLLQPLFQPSEIEKLSNAVQSVCDTLIDSFAEKGRCEFINDFGQLFPAYIFLELMGLPKDKLDQFLEWEVMFFRGETVEERIAGIRKIHAYLEDFAADRKQSPTDDLASKIVTAEINGRPINHDEIMGMFVVLYLGGLDTVLSTLGWFMRALVNDQALQSHLRDHPEDIPTAVEELLRAHGLTATRRMVTQDIDFHGVHMKKGDIVTLPTFLAGRDPQAFDDPHKIDIRRKPRHLTFATGVHNCLGIHLARRELKIVLESFLSRFRNIRVPEGETIQHHTQAVWGIHHLPLTWDQ